MDYPAAAAFSRQPQQEVAPVAGPSAHQQWWPPHDPAATPHPGFHTAYTSHNHSHIPGHILNSHNNYNSMHGGVSPLATADPTLAMDAGAQRFTCTYASIFSSSVHCYSLLPY